MPLFGGLPDVEKMRSKRDVRGLIRALSYQKDADLRKTAAEALGQIADEQAVEPLIVATKDTDLQVREAAMHALGEIGDTRAVEPLIAALNDESQDVRKAAARALDKLGWQPGQDQVGVQFWILLERWDKCVELGAPAVEPLIATLKDNKDERVISAIKSLGQIGDVRAVESLITMMEHGTGSSVHSAAAQALGQIGDARAVESLIVALEGWSKQHWSQELTEAAIQALGQIGDARAVEPLLAAWKKWSGGYSDVALAKAAIQALGQIGDTRAVEPFIAALNAGSVFVIEALVRFGAVVVNPLIAALTNPYSGARKRAAEALVELGWKPDQDQTWAQYWVARQNWQECVAIGAPAVEPLIAVLDHPDGDAMARAAAQTLGQIGAAAVIPLLTIQGWPGRNHAEAVLDQRGADAVEPLNAALKDENEDLRCAAAKALVRLYQLPKIPAQLKQIIRAERDLITKQGWHWIQHVDVLIDYCGNQHDDSRSEEYSNVEFPL